MLNKRCLWQKNNFSCSSACREYSGSFCFLREMVATTKSEATHLHRSAVKPTLFAIKKNSVTKLYFLARVAFSISMDFLAAG